MLNIFNADEGTVRYVELGRAVREGRVRRGMTQAALARASGLTRTTVNQLEAGLCPDLGVKKVIRLLAEVGLSLETAPLKERRRRDYLRMACVSANVGFRDQMSADELAHVLLTGSVPGRLRPHVRFVLEEAPIEVLRGVVSQLSEAVPKPERVTEGLRSAARSLRVDLARRPDLLERSD